MTRVRAAAIGALLLLSAALAWSAAGTKSPTFDPAAGDRGVLAVSATHLQGIYFGTDVYAGLRARKPLAVLGGSIYVYGPFGPQAHRRVGYLETAIDRASGQP